jgi:restriction endonuclease S subunit
MTGMQIKDTIESTERQMEGLDVQIKKFEEQYEKGGKQLDFTGKCLVLFESAKHKD